MDSTDVLALGALLSQLPDRDSYLRAVSQQLYRLVPGGDVL